MATKPLLDGTRTSPDWAGSRTKVCVLPVGTFEQHSRHLPLASDNIHAQYFGEYVARELGAALLPVLPYATSLEQTGFAGTISLRPETLMQIIRDIAAETEALGFRTMILLNNHGGNFALGPVVRDINRRDGPLKIILAGFWEFADVSVCESARSGKIDLHSGEFETSILMAIAPETVQPGAVDMKQRHNWKQTDLNTFGVGYFAPDGAPGNPSLASREKGEKLVASIKRNIIPFLRERLGWLEQDRSYSGKGKKKR